MAMISYKCVTSCSRRILSGLLNLDAVRTNNIKCLHVNMKRPCVATLQSRYTCCALRHDQFHPVDYVRCSGKDRFYCDLRSIRDDTTAHNEDIAGSPAMSLSADPQNADLRRKIPQAFNIDVLVALLRQENAVDVCVIKVPKSLKYTDYFVVVSGSSRRHLIAMAEYAVKVYKALKTDADPHVIIEGKDAEDWMCIDFGHTVVHFMLPETREVYELEKLWTLRSFDEQLSSIPPETLPKDFIYDDEATDWRSGFGDLGGQERL
ncbi:mitochondrial assembly of ribosomal large subunit protein 1 [Brienomyrus brachyistius]|uniref:mitochondrial assembly of ribosomal large subunit protein 1 n=1 Tax=Brienomyrus brachyistius TaxID=42636 RepID=UPI0020B26287|nr:mitochondrial assembly of ribosomal large subunit protein 1 [Brienomyrus brachyistius]